ncbi:MAG: metal dependent phosphohydrolase [Firmicutes bacterium]|nr:metal dependent phosphohydrolase [Bacillota bacterium]
MKWAPLLTGSLIGTLTVSGSLALYDVLRHPAPLLGRGQAVILILAVCLNLVRVDLFHYWYTKSRQSNAASLGVVGAFLALGLYGVGMATVAALLQGLVYAIVRRTAWYRALFNIGLLTTAAYVAGLAYDRLVPHPASWDARLVMASVAAVTLSFVLQRLCLTVVISLSVNRPFGAVWGDNLVWMVVQQAGLGLVGLLLGRFVGLGMTAVGVVLLGSPLMLLHYSYMTFAERTKDYVREIESANSELAKLNDELRATNDELIQTFGAILDARDRYTYGHSAQVATYAVALGEKLGLSQPELERLRQAALLHDIGKVGIPESVLLKPGPLDPHERRVMQAHAEIGYRITSQVHSLAHVSEIIRQHHEWMGGGGYPLKLKGEQILLPARIIGVADALDTLVSDRPYRKGKPVEVAFQEIRRCAGTQFDPQVVQALEQLFRERGGLWFANSAAGVGASPLALELAAAMEPPGT